MDVRAASNGDVVFRVALDAVRAVVRDRAGRGRRPGRDGGRGEAPEDTYRWARCNAPLPLENVRALGVPLPTSELSDVQAGLTWDQIAFGLNFVEVKGVQTKVVRLQYLPKMEAD